MRPVPDWLQALMAILVVLALPFLFVLLLKAAHGLARWQLNPFRRAAIWYLVTLKQAIEWAGKEPGE